ncbi:MAG: hypothetical protein LBQ24_03525 [Candidatus Peribacteria bacterium]|nr:hypothetical protein [Candidatus Peribacteria bacterium]
MLEKIKKIKRDLDVNADNLGDLELEEATLLYLTEDEVKNLLDEEDPEGKDYKFGE